MAIFVYSENPYPVYEEFDDYENYDNDGTQEYKEPACGEYVGRNLREFSTIQMAQAFIETEVGCTAANTKLNYSVFEGEMLGLSITQSKLVVELKRQLPTIEPIVELDTRKLKTRHVHVESECSWVIHYDSMLSDITIINVGVPLLAVKVWKGPALFDYYDYVVAFEDCPKRVTLEFTEPCSGVVDFVWR